MFSRIRRRPSLSMETLEGRQLLTGAAELVNDFDFSNVSSRNSPISLSVSDDATYQIVRQRDPHRNDYTLIGRIDDDVAQFARIEGNVESQTVVDDQLYAVTTTDWERRIHTLWKTDGTDEGTHRLLSTDGRTLGHLNSFNDRLYFRATDELWVSDGAESGTQRVLDLNPYRGTCAGLCGERVSDTILGFAAFDETMFFGIKRLANETEIWTTDGTTVGTRLVTVVPGDAYVGGTTDGQLIIRNSDGVWASDGTIEGTIESTNYDVLLDREAIRAGDRFFFHSGQELWVSDGTADGSRLVKEITLAGNLDGCGITAMISASDTVYFLAEDIYGNSGLWKSDGTENGTILISDTWLEPIIAVGETVYLAGYDEATGLELWQTDGTPDGTMQMMDLNPGPESSLNRRWLEVVAVKDELFFTADDGIHGFNLWRMPLVSPANIERTPGDSNNDGVFDSSDLVHVFQAGKYEDDIPQNASFADGDWNGDGEFDSTDLVFAFQAGNYFIAAGEISRLDLTESLLLDFANGKDPKTVDQHFVLSVDELDKL